MQRKAPRFSEESTLSVLQWKERIASEDIDRISFARKHEAVVSTYIELDKGMQRRTPTPFLTQSQIKRGRVPSTAWNSLPPIPGPSPDWFKTNANWATSRRIGEGTSKCKQFITLHHNIMGCAPKVRRHGDFYDTMKWPRGCVV